MKILSGRTHIALARKLANIIGCLYVESFIQPFDDGELRIQILEDLYGEEVIIVQSTSKPVNDNLMELLLLIDAVNGAGAKNITAIIPYFGYSRQDRKFDDHGPIAARLVVSLLEATNLSQIITMDLHSYPLEGFFKIPILNLDPISIFAPIIESYKNPMIIAPDIGSIIRTRKVSQNFNMDIGIINKTRDIDNQCHVHDLIGDVKGRNCLIIDDIIDTGKTISKGAELLMKKGASSVNAFITHAVLSSDVVHDIIDKSIVQNVYVTDTIVSEKISTKFHELSIMKLIANSLNDNFVPKTP